MVLDTLRFLEQLEGVEIVKIDIPYPLTSKEVLIDLVSNVLSTTNIRFCIFSHISSMVRQFSLHLLLLDYCIVLSMPPRLTIFCFLLSV